MPEELRLQHLGEALGGVVGEVPGPEEHASQDLRGVAAEPDLAGHLLRREQRPGVGLAGRPVEGVPRVEVPAADLLRPPGGQALVVLGAAEGPVELRHEVVHAPRREPGRGVREDDVVRVQAADALGHAVLPDAEGADAELQGRLEGAKAVGHLGDEEVDVVAAPLGQAGESPALLGEGGRVLGADVVRRVGVEVVVEVDPVDVVAAGHVHDDAGDVVPHGGPARVQDAQIAELQHPLRTGPRHVVGGPLVRGAFAAPGRG